ncbi:unnamed protein product [Ectocarpus sp. CCAP 1310/34]|nr:unnamed protein product [Ectocarpus sp. CCAP 1310/34]
MRCVSQHRPIPLGFRNLTLPAAAMTSGPSSPASKLPAQYFPAGGQRMGGPGDLLPRLHRVAPQTVCPARLLCALRRCQRRLTPPLLPPPPWQAASDFSLAPP